MIGETTVGVADAARGDRDHRWRWSALATVATIAVKVHGVIVGESLVDGHTCAVSRDPVTTELTDLQTLGGSDPAAFAIDVSGVAVGWSLDADGVRRAVACEPAAVRPWIDGRGSSPTGDEIGRTTSPADVPTELLDR
jgi:hypothetical protein